LAYVAVSGAAVYGECAGCGAHPAAYAVAAACARYALAVACDVGGVAFAHVYVPGYVDLVATVQADRVKADVVRA